MAVLAVPELRPCLTTTRRQLSADPVCSVVQHLQSLFISRQIPGALIVRCSLLSPVHLILDHLHSATVRDVTTMQGQPNRATYSTTTPYSPEASSSYSRRPSQYPPRMTSPPSSTFFSQRPDVEHEMQPVADAERHFGSSSSFRRHGASAGPIASQNSGFPVFDTIRSAVVEEGPSGIWDNLVGLVKGVKHGNGPEQNGYELAHKLPEQTASAKYSSYEAEVRPLSSPSFLPDKST